jgi:hypothetical protein
MAKARSRKAAAEVVPRIGATSSGTAKPNRLPTAFETRLYEVSAGLHQHPATLPPTIVR